MRRLHLFEWEDQPWLPRVFRDFITDHLRYTHGEAMREPVNRAIAARLDALLDRAGTTELVDLCAGAGGPVTRIVGLLNAGRAEPATVTVTDLFPNVAAFRDLERSNGGVIRARYESTDATDVPLSLSGVRTMFTALHHFQPDLAQRVLADAVRKRAPIAVFEPLERTVRMMVLVGLMSFLRGFTHTHKVAPLTPLRALFTYLIPLAPAMFAWDGSVSTLRSYTAGELLALTREIPGGGYRWEAGRFEVDGPYGLMPTTFLIGVPDTSE